MVAQTRNLLAIMQETWVRSLGWEDPLEKEMTTHSSILAWEIPWTNEPGGLQSRGSQRVGQDLLTRQQQQDASLTEAPLALGISFIILRKSRESTQRKILMFD